MKVTFLDIETSGGKFDCPVQVAYHAYGEYTGWDADERCVSNFYVIPDDNIIANCYAVHGQTIASLKSRGAHPLSESRRELCDMWDCLVSSDLVVGYGIKDFDIPRLQEASKRAEVEGSRVKVLDLLEVARRYYDKNVVGDHKMDSMVAHLMPDHLRQYKQDRVFHDADHDCSWAALLADAMCADLHKSLTELYDAMDVPVKVETFPIGKYRGKKISEVLADSSYCEWLGKQEWFITDYPDACYSLCVHGKDEAVVGPQVIAAIKAAKAAKAAGATAAKKADPAPVAMTPNPDPCGVTFDGAVAGMLPVSQALGEVGTNEFLDSLPF